MEIAIKKEGGAAIVSVKGRIDALTAGEFEKSLAELMDGGSCTQIIDFKGLDFEWQTVQIDFKLRIIRHKFPFFMLLNNQIGFFSP